MIDLYTAATPNGHKASLPFRLVDAALSFIVPQDTKPHLADISQITSRLVEIIPS